MNRIKSCGWVLLAALGPAACSDDSVEPGVPQGQEVAVIVTSSDRGLTVFPVDSPQLAFSLGLSPDGSPVSVAARERLAVVPLGSFPGVAVVDLVARRVTSTIALPLRSGATGAAFLNDSIALVANTNLNSVTPVNVRRGTSAAAIAVGTFPQHAISLGDTVYVLNAELGADFNPRRSGTVSVITGSAPRVVATIELTGLNPAAAAVGRDGFLYVLNSGTFATPSGSLSVIDRRTLREVRHETGFGSFPGGIAAGVDGRLYVASFNYGIAVWDPVTRTFVRAPAAAIQPGGIASSSGVGVDASGRVYALKPECRNPGVSYRLTAAFAVEREVNTGICPIAITFTRLLP
jgi:DNA-binding beta-propeller fold protein YncE